MRTLAAALLLFLGAIPAAAEQPDPVPRVLQALGSDADSWSLTELKDKRIERWFPDCRIFAADWVGTEKKPIRSKLALVSGDPMTVDVLKQFMDVGKLVPHAAKVTSDEELRELTGILGGMAQLLLQTEGPAEFTPDETELRDPANPGVVWCSLFRVRRSADGIVLETKIAQEAEAESKDE